MQWRDRHLEEYFSGHRLSKQQLLAFNVNKEDHEDMPRDRLTQPHQPPHIIKAWIVSDSHILWFDIASTGTLSTLVEKRRAR
jgi:hypothetical protein